MKKALPWLALGLGAYIAFLISTFPAAAASRWLAPPQVAVRQPAGTVWSGRATSVVLPGLTLGEVGWTLNVLPLFRGRLAGDVQARLPDGFIDAHFSVSLQRRIELTNLQLSTSLQTLRDVLPIYDTSGQISASVERLTLANGWPTQALGEIRLGNLEVAPFLQTSAASTIALGDYRAVLVDSSEPGVFAELSDMDGPLELSGMLELHPDRSYLIEGHVRARPNAPATLRQGIDLMTGEPDADGMRLLTLAGSL